MKILVIKISPIDGLNSSTLRTLGLIKGLHTLGHKITVLTIPLSSVHVVNNCEQYTFLQEIEIIRTNSNQMYDRITNISAQGNKLHSLVRGLKKLAKSFTIYSNYTTRIAKNLKISLLNEVEYDIVISVSDPKSSHIAVKSLTKQGLKYKRWVQYWGDPLATDITNKTRLPQWVLRLAEKKLLQNADQVYYTSPFTLDEQQQLYKKLATKMEYVPTPCIESKIYPDTNNSEFQISYIGAYNSRVRNILPFYEACVAMKQQIKVNIIGDSDLKLEPTSNISIYLRQNAESYMQKSDLLICILNQKGKQIPGKIYHYAATNKAVLVILDGDMQTEMQAFIKKLNRFWICQNDPEDIKKTIEGIIAKDAKWEPSELVDSARVASFFIQ